MDARLARMEMANDRSARVDVTRARGTTRRGYGNHARARTFSVDGERDEEGEEDVGARGRRGKGNRSRWLI